MNTGKQVLLNNYQNLIKFKIEDVPSCTDLIAYVSLTEPLELPNGTLKRIGAIGGGDSFNGNIANCYMYIDDYELSSYNLKIHLKRTDNNIKDYHVKETTLIPCTSADNVSGTFWNGPELGKIMFDKTDKLPVQIEGTVIL